jgi:hypothetical protein
MKRWWLLDEGEMAAADPRRKRRWPRDLGGVGGRQAFDGEEVAAADLDERGGGGGSFVEDAAASSTKSWRQRLSVVRWDASQSRRPR